MDPLGSSCLDHLQVMGSQRTARAGASAPRSKVSSSSAFSSLLVSQCDNVGASRRGEVVRHARAHHPGSDNDDLGGLAHPPCWGATARRERFGTVVAISTVGRTPEGATARRA